MGMSGLIFAATLGYMGILAWLIADLGHSRRWRLRRAELGARGDWQELTEYFEKEIGCRRPLLRLFRTMVLPGLLEAEYALHLSNQGEHEKALAWADRAGSRSGWRKVLGKKLKVRALILCRLGRYQEAEAVVAKSRVSSAGEAQTEVVEGLIQLYQGRVEAALGQQAIHEPRLTSAARALVSTALVLMGRFQDAVNILIYEPSNVLVYFKPDELQQVTRDDLGRRLVLALDEKHASVTRPARHLEIASACFEAGDWQSLERAVRRAERELKSHPIVERIYLRLQACSCASKGDTAGTENNLARVRQSVDEAPNRSAKYEAHQAAGRAYSLLGWSERAFSEFQEAAKLALHPLEQHTTKYWLARAAEAAGRREEALGNFRRVVADGFNTRMSADARARLDAPGVTPQPVSESLNLGEY